MNDDDDDDYDDDDDDDNLSCIAIYLINSSANFELPIA